MLIELKGRDKHFTFNCLGKFNVLRGDSGSYKSYFINRLVRWKQGSKVFTVDITTDDGVTLTKNEVLLYSNEYTDDANIPNVLATKTGCLFVVDEESLFFTTQNLAKLMLNSHNYFLLITRYKLSWLPVSVDSIYKFTYSNGSIINEPLYPLQVLCDKYNATPEDITKLWECIPKHKRETCHDKERLLLEFAPAYFAVK